MKFWPRKESLESTNREHGSDSASWTRSRFLAAGHYRVPAVEDTVGLTSPSKVVLNRSPAEVRRLTDLTFSSIQTTSKDVKDDAVTEVRLRQQRAMRDFLMGA
jgi:hypothetical protein